MLFNSLEFALFLPVVFCIYWLIANKDLRLQNFFVLSASYIFYGWWDWRFLSLIIASSTLDYIVGLRLARTERVAPRKVLLAFSILGNSGAQ